MEFLTLIIAAAAVGSFALLMRDNAPASSGSYTPQPTAPKTPPETDTQTGLKGGSPRDQPDRELLARTIWGEARGEPYQGMLAVGEVILNRTVTRRYSDGTIVGTILREWQFSAWNLGDPNRALMLAATFSTGSFLLAWQAAGEVLDGRKVLGAEDWRHYYNPKVASPNWADDFTESRKIGNHLFLRGTK